MLITINFLCLFIWVIWYITVIYFLLMKAVLSRLSSVSIKYVSQNLITGKMKINIFKLIDYI